MTVKLLAECHFEFLSLKGGCIGSSEYATLLEISCHGSYGLLKYMTSFPCRIPLSPLKPIEPIAGIQDDLTGMVLR